MKPLNKLLGNTPGWKSSVHQITHCLYQFSGRMQGLTVHGTPCTCCVGFMWKPWTGDKFWAGWRRLRLFPGKMASGATWKSSHSTEILRGVENATELSSFRSYNGRGLWMLIHSYFKIFLHYTVVFCSIFRWLFYDSVWERKIISLRIHYRNNGTCFHLMFTSIQNFIFQL